jgi:hypothetical protein
MARAGYDPRDMASMFKTIEQQSSDRAPQWLSDHPDPGNRYAYISREAQSIQVQARPDTGQLQTVKADLQKLPPAPTTEQIMKNAQRNAQQNAGADQAPGSVGTSGSLSASVEPPSGQFKTYDVGSVFQVSVPDNWQELRGDGSVTFAPAGGFGASNGANIFTHGVQMGVTRSESRDLQSASQELVQAFAQGNPSLQQEGQPQPVNFAGRQGLQVRLRNVSEATGAPEVVILTTALLDDGNVFYSVGVAPESQFAEYSQTLRRVNQSVRLEK